MDEKTPMRKSPKKVDDGDDDVKELPVIARPRYELVLTGELERDSDYYNELTRSASSTLYYQQMSNKVIASRSDDMRSGLRTYNSVEMQEEQNDVFNNYTDNIFYCFKVFVVILFFTICTALLIWAYYAHQHYEYLQD